MFRKCILLFCICFLSTSYQAQTYQLSGGNIESFGWGTSFNAESLSDHIKLTSDDRYLVGAVYLQSDLRGYLPNLKLCSSWKVEFDFKIGGEGTKTHGKGDGFAFWHMLNIPSNGSLVNDLGLTEGAYGLMIGFDTHDEHTEKRINKIHILYGENTANIEDNPNAFHSADLSDKIDFINAERSYNAIITGERVNGIDWKIDISVDNKLLVSTIVSPSGKAIDMNRGSFGFSASTKNATSRHQVTNVKIFVDRILTYSDSFSTPIICPDPITGIATADLTSYHKDIGDIKPEFNVQYFDSNGNLILDPKRYQLKSKTDSVTILITDPKGKLCDGRVTLKLNTIELSVFNTTLLSCGNLTKKFDLTLAHITNQDNVEITYFETINDLNLNQNKINQPESFQSNFISKIYAKIFDKTTKCYRVAEIDLKFLDEDFNVYNTEIKICSSQSGTGLTNLLDVNITNEPNVVKEFYKSYSDAVASRNKITNPTIFETKGENIYARVTKSSGCFRIVTIKVDLIPSIKIDNIDFKAGVITIEASGGVKPYEYSDDGTNWQPSNIFTGVDSEFGYYYVRDKTGCNLVQTAKPKIDLMNVFTPNGDGYNDYFDFQHLSKKENLEVKIFDRAGKLVYTFYPGQKLVWDGKVNGAVSPTGSYWYIITWSEINNNQTIQEVQKGWILLRNR